MQFFLIFNFVSFLSKLASTDAREICFNVNQVFFFSIFNFLLSFSFCTFSLSLSPLFFRLVFFSFFPDSLISTSVSIKLSLVYTLFLCFSFCFSLINRPVEAPFLSPLPLDATDQLCFTQHQPGYIGATFGSFP